MIVEKDKVISLSYKLKENTTNEVVEEVNLDNPLTFIFGSGSLLPKFEENVDGLKIGDAFEFILPSDEAYGPVNESAITELPKSIFVVDGQAREDLLVVGKSIPMKDNQGRRIDGLVTEIKDEAVIMNFNHPMAGKDLNFKGEVVGVREATQDELTNGLYADSCGCGSGGCGTESDGGCNTDSCDSGCGC